MDSLKNIYNLLPMIINSLLSDKNEQNLSYEQLTEALIKLCRNINGNCVPMSHARLKKITASDFEITLEALVVSAFYHYQGRLEQAQNDQEVEVFHALAKAMKTLHIKKSDPDCLKKIPRAHVLKVLFNINRMNYCLAA
ncbi:hypothetical protein [Psychromonas algicola]|uniref:hypothetical protein n=1 Tax=Psychromonas algicola TaxID=2555642 RepID=UPI001067BC36|nr:hypothetical protein [Psychromonas sp. RZ5]TEW46772.1 hypothetical protein E2R67_13020 [Psychromonas sp. RZ5]